MGEKDKPDPRANDELLRAVIQESASLRTLIERVRFGEILLQFTDKQPVTGYVKQTTRF